MGVRKVGRNRQVGAVGEEISLCNNNLQQRVTRVAETACLAEIARMVARIVEAQRPPVQGLTLQGPPVEEQGATRGNCGAVRQEEK